MGLIVSYINKLMYRPKEIQEMQQGSMRPL